MKTQESLDGSHKVATSPQCGTCDVTMEFDRNYVPWAETGTLVIIPIVCPKCGYGSRIELGVEFE